MNLDCITAQFIVDQLGKWLAHDIWVVDHANQILAFHRSIRREPASSEDPWTHTDDLQRVEHRFNLPLHCANQEVGRLMIDSTNELGIESAQAAQTLAELIIHQRAVLNQSVDRQWTLDKFIYDLLHSSLEPNDAATLDYATFMGIDLTIPRLAVVIDPLTPVDPSSPLPVHPSQPVDKVEQIRRQVRWRLIDRVQRFLGAGYPHIYSVFDEHHFVILLVLDAEPMEDAAQCVQSCIQSLLNALACSTNEQFTAGIGAYHAGWQALAQSYQDACFALETGRTLFCAGRAYTASDLGLAGFVGANNSAFKSELADKVLRLLYAEPELLQTLTIFLGAGLSVGLAAEQLHLHRHGLTYRLKKIHELTGLDPTTFRHAAQLDAALQWQRMTKAKQAS